MGDSQALSIVLLLWKAFPAVQFTLLRISTSPHSLGPPRHNDIRNLLTAKLNSRNCNQPKVKMISNIITVTALLASAPLANAFGNAVVKNACKYEVKLCNVPASGGGYEQIDKMIQPNETYTQEYTELTNGNGWAIKLSD